MNDLSHSEIAQSESPDAGDPLSACLRRTLPNKNKQSQLSSGRVQESKHFSVRLSGQEVL